MATLSAMLADEGLSASGWSNGPGDRYAVHGHGYDKVIVVVRGTIAFVLPASAEEVELVAGDRLELPAGTQHGAIVGTAGVECLEAHLPAGSLGQGTRRIAAWASAGVACQTESTASA